MLSELLETQRGVSEWSLGIINFPICICFVFSGSFLSIVQFHMHAFGASCNLLVSALGVNDLRSVIFNSADEISLLSMDFSVPFFFSR